MLEELISELGKQDFCCMKQEFSDLHCLSSTAEIGLKGNSLLKKGKVCDFQTMMMYARFRLALHK
jgi:hypothetical protein